MLLRRSGRDRPETTPPDEGGEKYLVFRVRREEFIVPADRVLEIRTAPKMVGKPGDGRPSMEISLHGSEVRVIDLGQRLGYPSKKLPGLACVVVVSVAVSDGTTKLAGVLVDGVQSLVSIPRRRIAPLAWGADCRIGRVRIHGRFKYLLNLDGLILTGNVRQ